jgi:S-DNA-T family DNA segregation ATPase FtsK/SpoIIIE
MQPDNIIIRRSGPTGTFPKGSIPHEQEPEEAPAPARPGRKATAAQQLKIAPVPGSAAPPPKPFKNHQQHMRILAILLFLFSALLLLALVSYTSRDEANTQLSMYEVNGLFRGDDMVRAKVETTHNWLGLVGAVVANSLYNYTFGFAAIVIPFLIALWGKDLFLKFTIPQKQVRNTSVVLVICVLFSGIMGTAQLIFPEISREWSGGIGQFLSAILSGLIGKTGSFLVMLSGIVITLIVGTDIDMDKISARIQAEFLKIKQHWNEAKAARTERKSAVAAGLAAQEETFKEPAKTVLKAEPQYEQTEEPARILKRNLERNPPMPPVAIQPEPKVARNPVFQQPEIRRAPEADMAPQNLVLKTPPQEIQNPVAFKNTDPVFKTPEPETPPAEPRSIPLVINTIDHPVPDAVEETAVTAAPVFAAPVITPPPTFLKTPTVTPQSDLLKEDNFKKEFGADDLEDDFDEFDDSIEFDEETGEILDEIQEEFEAAPQKKVLTLDVQELVKPEPQVAKLPVVDVMDEEINYQPLTLELLVDQDDKMEVNDAELKENARLLQDKLATFKIQIENLTVTPGPVVTQYEFVPAAGIKVSQIENLSDDIALALKARGIRIIAPVPGRGTVGIEIPNHNPAIVRFSSIVKSQKFNSDEFRLPLALGKTITGEVYCTDLAKMPHLLIAGSTGSGKSVGMNTILGSLLFKKHPRDLKFVIIDPKKVEMTQYAALRNHYLAICPDIDEEIITNPANAVLALKSVEAEMERRYDILASVGQRNIVDYNAKVNEGKYKDTTDMVHRPLPYIVVIIDELADLMMTAGREVEDPITRLAQLARAIGIHLVVATQRPSVDVITGLIKANFPARIAYQVASKFDSRTILDMVGAEFLLGNGDMLFLPGGSPKPLRVQNAFISTDEVEALCEHIGKQRGYTQPFTLPSLQAKTAGGASLVSDERDPLFEEAARLIVRHQQGSVSLLQRRLKVGYSRAARIVDELEAAGIVGPFEGSKARAVLLESEAELEAYI